MFGLFKKKKEEQQADVTIDYSALGIDMHSHLLPGIDDGSPDAATSVNYIKKMMGLGYRKFITTPHIYPDLYPNNRETITAALEVLKEKLKEEQVDVEVHAAAEYFIDDHFEDQLQTKQPFLKLSGNMVLVEFSMVTAPMDLQQVIFELQMQNYQPVLAHPERYVYLSRHKSTFDDLRSAGCFFQVNLLSLTGHYGPAVLELAEYLVKENMYDFAGTDIHNKRHLDGLKKLHPAHLKRLQDSGKIKNQLL